jgi:hypothetical protein
MRRLRNAIVASFVVLLVAIAPVSAGGPPRTGYQIDLFNPPATAPANEPFWVGHGWCSTADDEDPLRSVLSPSTRVTFTLDGQTLVTGTDVSFNVSFDDGVTCVAYKINYHNFASGLPAGSHTITGCWYLLGDLWFCREATIEFE